MSKDGWIMKKLFLASLLTNNFCHAEQILSIKVNLSWPLGNWSPYQRKLITLPQVTFSGNFTTFWTIISFLLQHFLIKKLLFDKVILRCYQPQNTDFKYRNRGFIKFFSKKLFFFNNDTEYHGFMSTKNPPFGRKKKLTFCGDF